MKYVVLVMLMVIGASAQAWPEGNWRYEATGYDELRQQHGIIAVNQPVSPDIDGWQEDEVLLSFSHNPKHGAMIFLKSNSTAFDCEKICEVNFRFDDDQIETVYFFNFPSSPDMLTLMNDNAIKFFEEIKTSDILILEVKRKHKSSEQFKYYLEGFMATPAEDAKSEG